MAKKALGQNFLLDRNITDKIIRLSLEKQNLPDFRNAEVFEIGPGPGGLTRSILRAAPKNLTVVEMDDRCIAIMEELKTLAPERLHIINGDALQADFGKMGNEPRHIVSNLPYNISVPLLTGWLKQIKNFASLTLMFQKEVADRITAEPATKTTGASPSLPDFFAELTACLTLIRIVLFPLLKSGQPFCFFVPCRKKSIPKF